MKGLKSYYIFGGVKKRAFGEAVHLVICTVNGILAPICEIQSGTSNHLLYTPITSPIIVFYTSACS